MKIAICDDEKFFRTELRSKLDEYAFKVKKRVNKMNITMTGHATVPVKRNIYGLSNEEYQWH